jgi:nitroreductase
VTVETWDAITSRRNVREFTGQPIPAEHLDRILEAGRRSPSARNWQPWDFIAVTQRDNLAGLAAVGPGSRHVAGSAATVALIGPVPQSDQQRARLNYDFGQATISMMIAAADLRIGSGHVGVRDQDLARRILGFPGDKYCAFMIAFGYPADRPLAPVRHPDRRPFEDVVHREHW